MPEIRSFMFPSTIGLSEGITSPDVEKLQEFLQHFGYLRIASANEGFAAVRTAANPPDANLGKFDEATTKALRDFQQFHGLPVTGVLDEATVVQMSLPRCGFPDIPTQQGVSDFTAQGNKWDTTNLTYGFQEFTPELTQQQVRSAIAEALNLWSQVTPLTFTEVPLASNPDFVIRFVAGDHGDGSPFDGVGRVLAHAFYPPPNGGAIAGDAHFDEGETWTVNIPVPAGGIDLITVAAHEFGHSLGLAHSSVAGALMFPSYSGPRRFLAQDDIDGIRSIYGARGFTITNGGVGDFAGWATSSDVRVITGDFNGNGRTDIALVRQDGGWNTIPIAFSNGDGTFTITNGGVGDFAAWATSSDVRVITGDFNGNGRTDIALVRQDGGWNTIPIAFSNGDGTFTITNGGVGDFAAWATSSDVRVITGDFNGNGRTDIALVRQDGGWNTIPIAFSNGDGTFTITNGGVGDFAAWATSSDVRVITGDFNGNGRTDIALVRQDGGWNTIPIAFSNGDGTFTITNGGVGDFAAWATSSDVRVITGDFNGNGRTDIALVRQDGGWNTIPIAFSNGDGTFTITNGGVGDFAAWATASSEVRVITGDFNGNGRTDIALVRQDGGWNTIPIAFSNGDGTFTITNSTVGDFAAWATASSEVRVIPGDFNGNGRTDIALVRQDGGWNTIPIAFSAAV